jgi:diacylglycerol kinase (ATP)
MTATANPVEQPKKKWLKVLFNKLKSLVALREKRARWVSVVVNPAAGQASPDLKVMNRIFHQAGYDWKMEITNDFGDGARIARKAVEGGASLVAAYGGDGTVMDVATGLIGSEVPMLILPGGTGNALAKELNIPIDLATACALAVDPQARIRLIDVGMVNERLFLLRLGVGLEATITRTADRDLKDRLGLFAYLSATLQALTQSPIAIYHLEIDGVVIEMEGAACMVANAATLGVPGIVISPQVQVDDGLLDVFIIRKTDLSELASLVAGMIGAPLFETLPHWQGKEIVLLAEPAQDVETDGEEIGETPLKISILPKMLKIIVPPEKITQ